MSLQTFLEEILASGTSLQLIVLASALTSIAFLVTRLYFKRSEDGIPVYTPQGDYKKRWSYDNPHALQEAYSKVS